MSVFLQMSLVGVGDILWVLRSTLRTHIRGGGGGDICPGQGKHFLHFDRLHSVT